MDRFVLVTGLAGLILLCIALVILVNLVVNMVKRRARLKASVSATFIFVIVTALALAFVYFSLFLQTFTRYTHEENIGWVFAEPYRDSMTVTFYDNRENRMHFFKVAGDQWMIEGYFLRWGTVLRWLGADAYYRITRFSGRWEEAVDKPTSIYQMRPEESMWKFLLKHAKKLPGVDTAYGIGAFQYPGRDTCYVYINDTGFILRRQ